MEKTESTTESNRKYISKNGNIYSALEIPFYSSIKDVKTAFVSKVKEIMLETGSLEKTAIEEFTKLCGVFKEVFTEEKKRNYDTNLAFIDPEIRIIVEEEYATTPAGQCIEWELRKDRLNSSDMLKKPRGTLYIIGENEIKLVLNPTNNS